MPGASSISIDRAGSDGSGRETPAGRARPPGGTGGPGSPARPRVRGRRREAPRPQGPKGRSRSPARPPGTAPRPDRARHRLPERVLRIVLPVTLAGVAVAALYAHTLFLQHAGALWRDEANTAAYAGMP